MNLFNRVVVVVLAVVASVSAIVVAIIPEQLLEVVTLVLGNITITPMDRIALVILAAVITIAALLLINAELHPEQRKGVRLVQVSGGHAELSTDSIAQRIRQELETLPEVVQVAPLVFTRGDRVDVRLTVHTSAEVDTPNKASEVLQLARRTVEQGMGVKLGNLNVMIKYHAQPVPSPQKA